MNRTVHIDASAPTRIDLAGGTIDIWPLYLFHDGAQTLNAAISLRARCAHRAARRRRIVIISEDTGDAGRSRALERADATAPSCACSALLAPLPGAGARR